MILLPSELTALAPAACSAASWPSLKRFPPEASKPIGLCRATVSRSRSGEMFDAPDHGILHRKSLRTWLFDYYAGAGGQSLSRAATCRRQAAARTSDLAVSRRREHDVTFSASGIPPRQTKSTRDQEDAARFDTRSCDIATLSLLSTEVYER